MTWPLAHCINRVGVGLQLVGMRVVSRTIALIHSKAAEVTPLSWSQLRAAIPVAIAPHCNKAVFFPQLPRSLDECII